MRLTIKKYLQNYVQVFKLFTNFVRLQILEVSTYQIVPQNVVCQGLVHCVNTEKNIIIAHFKRLTVHHHR